MQEVYKQDSNVHQDIYYYMCLLYICVKTFDPIEKYQKTYNCSVTRRGSLSFCKMLMCAIKKLNINCCILLSW